MRKLIRASAIIITLAVPAWAGNIGCPVAPPPGGRQAPASTKPAKTGEIGCSLAGSEIARTLLQTLLGLF